MSRKVEKICEICNRPFMGHDFGEGARTNQKVCYEVECRRILNERYKNRELEARKKRKRERTKKDRYMPKYSVRNCLKCDFPVPIGSHLCSRCKDENANFYEGVW